MMLRNIGLASVWILPGIDHPDQLHHTAVFVRESVAVQHIRAREIHKLMPDADPSRHDLPVDGCARGNGNHVVPDLVRHRLIYDVRGAARTIDGRSIEFHHLKRIDVNVEHMRNRRGFSNTQSCNPLMGMHWSMIGSAVLQLRRGQYWLGGEVTRTTAGRVQMAAV
jgi:hypothetical protein